MASNPTPRHTSYPLLLAVYLGMLIGGMVLLYALVYVVEEFFNTTFPSNSAMGLILIVVSAMTTGTYWYNREIAVPSSGRKWTLALLITTLTIAVQAGLIYLMASVGGEMDAMMREIAGEDGALIIGIFAFFIVIMFLMVRASIWSGVRSGVKQQERIAAKSGR